MRTQKYYCILQCEMESIVVVSPLAGLLFGLAGALHSWVLAVAASVLAAHVVLIFWNIRSESSEPDEEQSP